MHCAHSAKRLGESVMLVRTAIVLLLGAKLLELG